MPIELIQRCIIIVTFPIVAIIITKNKKIQKKLEFIQNCIATFIFTYGFVSASTLSLYYSTVKLGLIDLNPENSNEKTNNDLDNIIIVCWTLIVVFAYNPTSLIIKGYMQRYDEKWKIYKHHDLYGLAVAIMSGSYIILIWFEYKGYEFPGWATDYLKAKHQSSYVLIAFLVHSYCLYKSAKSLEKST